MELVWGKHKKYSTIGLRIHCYDEPISSMELADNGFVAALDCVPVNATQALVVSNKSSKQQIEAKDRKMPCWGTCSFCRTRIHCRETPPRTAGSSLGVGQTQRTPVLYSWAPLGHDELHYRLSWGLTAWAMCRLLPPSNDKSCLVVYHHIRGTVPQPDHVDSQTRISNGSV